ncbi:Fic family protein [Lysobacter sp. Root983]|uniref:Fic family protein n=1 Tax=Lysobacter sp. Root983 TaxID=1736613 RepID=UPI0009ECA396|nr:Fic family protein [Lysobacter sp. Root983]
MLAVEHTDGLEPAISASQFQLYAQSIRGWRLPMGRTDALPSGASGLPLRYFTPDPITEIVARCSVAPFQRQHQGNDPAIALLFCRAASRNAAGEVDLLQSNRLCREVLATSQLPMDVPALISLAREIWPATTGLRREISFAGGSTASTATKIYAPHPELPQLMASLAELSHELPAIDPLVLSSLIGYFCANAHPFSDGNGRWSRLVALRISKSKGLVATSINITFQNLLKLGLATKVWPMTHHEGPEKYLRHAVTFEQLISKELSASGLSTISKSITKVISERCNNGKARRDVLLDIYGTGRLSKDRLRSLMPLSERSAANLLLQIEESGNGLLTSSDEILSASLLHRRTDEILRVAAIQTIEQ